MGDLRRLSHDDDRAAERAVFLTALVDWLFTRGHVADLVLGVMLVESVALVTLGRWRPGAAALRIAPGALMIFALRGALVGWHPGWIALALAAAFPVHLMDLRRGAPGRH